ncbi:unnamed protein product [Linum tenue]|uniref:Uncharacterized protein n=1 Tax=Linum tenue TaxID=586396 RepID=A0AAV0KIL9_9ROSI|nr:unnamed protein product [Linum tenue]
MEKQRERIEGEKICRRYKQSFTSSSNNSAACRFHPSFFVCRRHDDQKRRGRVGFGGGGGLCGEWDEGKGERVVEDGWGGLREEDALGWGGGGGLVDGGGVASGGWAEDEVGLVGCRCDYGFAYDRRAVGEFGKERVGDEAESQWSGRDGKGEGKGERVVEDGWGGLREEDALGWGGGGGLVDGGGVASGGYYELGPNDPPYAAKFYDCCGAEQPDAPGCSTAFHLSYDDD